MRRAYFYGPDGEPRLYWHSQRLKEDRFGRTGPLWQHGRGWVHIGRRLALGAEWLWAWRGFAASVEVGGEDDLKLHSGLGFFSLWLHVEGVFPGRWRLREREWGFSTHDGGIWVKWGADPHSWSSGQPWWWEWNFNPADFFLGRPRHSEEILKVVDSEVPTPEGVYPCRITFSESTWRRPRWLWGKKRIGAEIEMFRPVPVPGKGENSWDCGEDAISSLSCGAQTVEDAVAAMVRSVVRDRLRHGGRGRKPEGVAP